MGTLDKTTRSEKKDLRESKKELRKDDKQSKENIKDAESREPAIRDAETDISTVNSETANLPEPISAESRIAEYKKTIPKSILKDDAEFAASLTKMPKDALRSNPKLDKKRLAELAKKQRASKVFDTFSAVGASLQGKTYDPSTSAANRLKGERQAKYDEYKNIAEGNRKTMAAWESKNNQRVIDWLKAQAADKNKSALEKQKYEQEVRLLERKNNAALKKAGITAKKEVAKKKAEKTDLDLYKDQYGYNTNELEDYIAKKYNIDIADVTEKQLEKEAGNILAEDYDVSVDDYGVKSLESKGNEYNFHQRKKNEDAINTMEEAKSNLDEAISAYNEANIFNKGKLEQKRDDAQKAFNEAKSNVDNLGTSNNPKESKSETSTLDKYL